MNKQPEKIESYLNEIMRLNEQVSNLIGNNLGLKNELFKAKSSARDEILKMLDSGSIECVLLHGKWWMDLGSLKSRISETLK